jgi:hypothetical protein
MRKEECVVKELCECTETKRILSSIKDGVKMSERETLLYQISNYIPFFFHRIFLSSSS